MQEYTDAYMCYSASMRKMGRVLYINSFWSNDAIRHHGCWSSSDQRPDWTFWCQAFIWTNADILSIIPRGAYFIGILFELRRFTFMNICLNMSAKWRPQCADTCYSSYAPSYTKCSLRYKVIAPCHDIIQNFKLIVSLKKRNSINDVRTILFVVASQKRR